MDRLKWNKTFAMEQAAEDADLLRELIDIFKESSEKDLREMEDGLVSGDTEKICRTAHSIKGAAASLGLEKIRELTFLVEEDSRAGSTTVASEKMAELKQLLSLLHEISC